MSVPRSMKAGERKRAYRYCVKETGGRDVGAVVGEFVLDWKYLGREYTWNVVSAKKGFETTAWFSGVYVDKGYLVGDEYKTDAELAEAAA